MNSLKTLEQYLIEVQGYITQNYSRSLAELNIEKQKPLIKTYIEKYINDKNINIDGMTKDDICKYILREMTGFSFLDDLLMSNDIEEINILSYKDIKIHKSNGEIIKSKEHFLSPQNSIDVIRRLINKSGKTLDEAHPFVVAHLNDNIRITIAGKGIYDEKLGLSASIRILKKEILHKKDFIENDECTEEMLDYLVESYKAGMSICISGETGSGKTTLMSYIMENIDNDKRLITIEEKTREFNLIKKDENGYMINNVIHLVTRESENEEQNISVTQLLKLALTFNPNYLSLAEMKGSESLQVIAAANTGHPTITTTHASGNEETYYRMLMLSKEMYDINDDTLLQMEAKAFPTVVYIKKLVDGKRRIMEISECVGIKNGIPELITIYKYQIDKTIIVNGKKQVIGKFIKKNIPSIKTRNTLIENGAMPNTINKFFSKKEEDGVL